MRGRMMNCLLSLAVTLCMWIESGESCACSPELQTEVYKLRDRIEYLETQLYTNCKKCPENYRALGGRCYRVSTERRSWMDAAVNCTREGAQLVSLQTQEEETLVRNYLQMSLEGFPFRARFYTAGNELEEKGVWRWGVGEESELLGEYSNWTPGEPNDHQGELEQCMEFHLGQGWFDVPCSLEFMWICETEPGLQWLDGQKAMIVENSQLDDQKYKPFWSNYKYSRKYQGKTDGDKNREVVNEYNSDVYDGKMGEENDENENNDEPVQVTDEEAPKVNGNVVESDMEDEAVENDDEEDQNIQNIPGAFTVTMETNN